MKLNKYLKQYFEAPIDLVPTHVPKKNETEMPLTIALKAGKFPISVSTEHVDKENSKPGLIKLSDVNGFLNDLKTALTEKKELANFLGSKIAFANDVAQKLEQNGISKNFIEFESSSKNGSTILHFSGVQVS